MTKYPLTPVRYVKDCECGHKKANHEPGCYWCGCAEYRPYTVKLERPTDFEGKKADVRSSVSGRVRRVRR